MCERGAQSASPPCSGAGALISPLPQVPCGSVPRVRSAVAARLSALLPAVLAAVPAAAGLCAAAGPTSPAPGPPPVPLAFACGWRYSELRPLP